MTPGPLSLWLGGVGWAAAIGLAATRMALARLSGGTVRKIELKDRALAERLENWLARRDELRVLLRLLLLLDFLFLAFCMAAWQRYCLVLDREMWTCWAVPVAAACLFFLLSEWLGRHLSDLTTGRFLSLSVPIVRALGGLLLPITLPVRAGKFWAARWHERHTEEAKATAEDEIMSLVEQDATNGEDVSALEADERRMIRGIFDLDETPVHEIMSPRVDVDAVKDAATIADVKARIIASGHSRIPVFHGTVDHIIGVVYAKDLLDDEKLAATGSLEDICHRPVFIPETKNVGDLLQEFRQNRNHFAIVLDEYGGTAGIVTFEDILEEIVGEIRDEYDTNESLPTTQVLPDGGLVADARMTIAELNEALDTEMPEDEDFDTLGGYISAHAGRIPQAGEAIETDLLTFEIVSAEPRRVLKAKVRRKPVESEDTHD